MKLELKHLAPYLPYKLKMEFLDFPLGKHYRLLELDCGHDFHFYFSQNKVRPILRPLSDLNKEIEVNGEKFVPCDFLKKIHFYPESNETMKIEIIDSILIECQIYWINEKLIEWHFDIFELIENGLAISIHDVWQADA